MRIGYKIIYIIRSYYMKKINLIVSIDESRIKTNHN